MYLRNSIVDVLKLMAKKSTKSGVWERIDRVSLDRALDLCPALEAADPKSTGPGAKTVRTAKLDLDGFSFHQWFDSTHGLCYLDARGDSFFIVGVIVSHITPPEGIKSPYLLLHCEVFPFPSPALSL